MGEPTFNGNVLDVAMCLKRNIYPYWKASHAMNGTIHPVVSTMLPKSNKKLGAFLDIWCNDIKNNLYNGEAGLQFSINSTSDKQRDEMFSGNSLDLQSISELGDNLPMPVGRKYALNFALADGYEIDAHYLRSLFDPEKFMVKLTPMHRTTSCIDNSIDTTDGYEYYTPYIETERILKSVGFDVLVFIPSLDEDESKITCGNAILAGDHEINPISELKKHIEIVSDEIDKSKKDFHE
jgi:23S rRNA (adenine2503-C2)-methyltransferase